MQETNRKVRDDHSNLPAAAVDGEAEMQHWHAEMQHLRYLIAQARLWAADLNGSIMPLDGLDEHLSERSGATMSTIVAP
jgi:hypothetical protein